MPGLSNIFDASDASSGSEMQPYDDGRGDGEQQTGDSGEASARTFAAEDGDGANGLVGTDGGYLPDPGALE